MTFLPPRSLFGRMMLIFLLGLALAQLLSAALLLRDRDKHLFRLGATQSAQRMADIVRLLDALPPAQRPEILAPLGSSALQISLDRPALEQPGKGADEDARAAILGEILRSQIGDSRPIQIAVAQTARPPQSLGPLAFSMTVRTQLRDGAWVTFVHSLPHEELTGPPRMALNLMILLAAVILLSLVAVRWATRPLLVLAAAAEELGRNIDRPPLAEEGPAEVRRAAHAFNTMQERLVRYIRDRARVLAAISHDLKTPITRLRLRSELLDDDELRTKFAQDLDEMESMVGAALDFLRGTERREPALPVDVMALLESLQEDYEEMGRRVGIEGATLGPYFCSPQELKRCLANLVDNAVNYGGHARILVDDDEERLRIRVRDAGPGIPGEELERVFEPFYRLEPSRNRASGGTGLGLSIARNIAQAHGGALTLHNLADGGLEAVLILPRRGAGTPSGKPGQET